MKRRGVYFKGSEVGFFPDCPKSVTGNMQINLASYLEQFNSPGPKKKPVQLPPKRLLRRDEPNPFDLKSRVAIDKDRQQMEWQPVPDSPQKEYYSEVPEYDQVVTDKVASSHSDDIQLGAHYDLLSMFKPEDFSYGLTTHPHVRPYEPTLRGKYILVCCCFVPVLWNSKYAESLRHLIAVCSDVFSSRKGVADFAMVMVPKMRKDWSKGNIQTVFWHFFSGFPQECFAVPFYDSHTCDYICKSLHLVDGSSKCLLLDGDQKVLLHTDASFFEYHGADLFPFTAVKKELYLWPEKELPRFSDIVGLENLLGWGLSTLQLYSWSCKNGEVGPVMSKKMSELTGKFVGLYLCYEGDSIRRLDQVHQQCREQNLEFELVVVLMPFYNYFDPEGFRRMIHAELHKWQVASSCWIMDFKDSVSRRLWLLCMSLRDDALERLIIVDCYGKVDPFALTILENFGGVDAYPFTRESLLEKELRRASALTIQSLLDHSSQDHLLAKRGGSMQRVSLGEIENKNVILYFDFGLTEDIRSDHVYESLANHYIDMKNKDPGVKVVVISSDPDGGLQPSAILDTLSATETYDWFFYPYSAEYSESLHSRLVCPLPTLVAFGQDGRIRSLAAHKLLISQGLQVFPFNGDIRQEIIDDFIEFGYHFMRELSTP